MTSKVIKAVYIQIIPQDDPKQALRLRRFFMAFVVYILACLLAYICYLANIMEWKSVYASLIGIPLINLILYTIFRTGLNRRMRDPSLTSIQMCISILVVTYGIYYANEARGLLLLVYIPIFLFGIFRLDTRQFLFISSFALLMYGIDIVLFHIFHPQQVNLNIEYFQWGVLSIALIVFSFMGGNLSSLRRHLSISRTELEKTVSLVKAEVEERKKAQEALIISEEKYRTVLENIENGYYEVDIAGNFTFFNDSMCQIWGYPKEELTGMNNRQYTDKENAKRLFQAFNEVYRTGKSLKGFDWQIIRKDGTNGCIEASVSLLKDSSGKKIGFRGITRDVTERKSAEEKIQYLATHDALTGLPNRLMFGQLLSHAIASAKRYQRQIALLFIDLDRFKAINDSLGHDAGDSLLQEITARLQQTLRAVDVVARLGGDEFVILIEELSDLNQVEAFAGKILSTVIKPMSLIGKECRITASIGISVFPRDAQDEQSLMKNADMAMYLAKEEGKNNYQFYSEHIQTQSLERLSIETCLRFALERNELSLQYQAQVDFKTNEITGVEALLRWQNQSLGSVAPAQFIPVAEETGLIVSIGRWVMRTACAQNVAWQRAGLPPVCMGVNLSLRQLMDEFLVEDIKKALADSGMAPNLLELEITESMVMHHPARMIAVLAKIKELGVRLAIDDFGTGYSSLAQVKHFPIDTLKVDRSFIRNITHDSEDKAITQAIIAMGKTLSLTVVAEGVETEEQMNFLKDHSCDEMQGFYFSKPIIPEQFADLLRKHVPFPPKST